MVYLKTQNKVSTMEKDQEFQYDDHFKEDVVHQLYHIAVLLKKINENIEKITDSRYVQPIGGW